MPPETSSRPILYYIQDTSISGFSVKLPGTLSHLTNQTVSHSCFPVLGIKLELAKRRGDYIL
jgi:hypothetical protein